MGTPHFSQNAEAEAFAFYFRAAFAVAKVVDVLRFVGSYEH